jgi:hypothetical protein
MVKPPRPPTSRRDKIKTRKSQESTPTMNTAALALVSFEPTLEISSDEQSIDRHMRAFVAGESDGDDLLHALYDHVLGDPIPQRLRDLLRR